MARLRSLLGLALGVFLICGFLVLPGQTLADAPTITASPASGPVGSDFSFTGTGLTPNASYGLSVTDDAGNVTGGGTVTTDDAGTFSLTITPTTAGTRTATLTGSDGSLAVTFTVTTPAVATSTPEVNDGGTLGYGGVGYAANATYLFRIADDAGNLTVDTTVTTIADGTFSGTITVNGVGTRTITVLTSAGTVLATTTYNVIP